MQATVNNPGFRVIGFIGFRVTFIVWYTIVYWEYLIFGGWGCVSIRGKVTTGPVRVDIGVPLVVWYNPLYIL